ncbi:MAG: DNA repair protein RecO [Candidatus Tectomicrobia bacterium]|nr:DNA repair protein RecO [Candidatus Tectomicrobia bacterium]
MALYRSDAFVLHTYKLGESDQIVVFFTQDYGKVRAVARRSRSARRQTASYYQPLMLLHAILFGRPSQALHRINSVDIVEPFRALREDFDIMQCGLYMTELIDVTTRDREAAPELFALLRLGLEELTQTPSTDTLLRLFEVQLLRLIGYTPQVFGCARCAQDTTSDDTTFSPSLGGLLCRACVREQRHTLTLQPETVAYMREAIMSEADTAPLLPQAPSLRQEIEHVLHQHLTARLGRELKSYAFLHL